MADPIYYLHIPKTGGTSLISFLDAQFAEEETCPAQLLPDLFALDRTALSRYGLFRGHLWYGLDRYLGSPLRYLTLLREPLQRTLSWYAHVRRDPNAYRHARVAGENWSLLDFVSDEETRWDLVNTQTLYLAADLDYARLAADPVGYGQRMVRGYALRRRDKDLLDLAKRRLERMDSFGITERMRDSIRLLARALGVDPPPEAPRLNASSERNAAEYLDAATLQAIEECIPLDRALYAWARELFAERCAALAAAPAHPQGQRRDTGGGLRQPALADESLPRLELRLLDCARVVAAGGEFAVKVALHNGSDEIVSSRPPHPVNLAYHWLDAETGDCAVYDGRRTSIAGVLGRGSRKEHWLRVAAPVRPGRFTLQVRLVQEGVRWLEDVDPRYQDRPVDVLPR